MLTISDAAAKEILTLKNKSLRLSIDGGGCAGFQYTFLFDTKINPDDKVFENNGATIVIDEISYQLIQGSIIDYKEDIMGCMYVIKNPNAKKSCGCGNSFGV